MYSSYSLTTSAVDRSKWSATPPGRALVPGKGPPVPIVQEAGWAPDTASRGRIVSPLPVIEPKSSDHPDQLSGTQ
jgi:hypothetical protein